MQIKRAFSLIELMIAIAIISVLVIIAVGSYVDITQSAKEAKAREEMTALVQAIKKYAIANNGKYPESLEQLVGQHINSVPTGPWGYKYTMDSFYVLCRTDEEIPGAENSLDERERYKFLKMPYRPIVSDATIVFEQGGSIYKIKTSQGVKNAKVIAQGTWPDYSGKVGRVVYEQAGKIYIVNIDGTNPVALTNGPSDGYPAISPDGQKVAFVRNSKLYFMPSTKQEEAGFKPDCISADWVVNASDKYGGPSFSPDGRRVVAVASGKGASNVLVIFFLNKNIPPRQLTKRGAMQPDWCPLAEKNEIVFAAEVGNYISLIKATNYMEERNDYFKDVPKGSQSSPTPVPVKEIFAYSRDPSTGKITFEQLKGENPCWSSDGEGILFTDTYNVARLFYFSTRELIPTSLFKIENIVRPRW